LIRIKWRRWAGVKRRFTGRAGGEESKAFFFEKKKQKTFTHFMFGAPDTLRAQMDKSFLVLFFKKEPLACFPP
jgi:hypothetical protein